MSATDTAYPGQELKGKIIVIEPVIDTDDAGRRVVARVKNPGRTLFRGCRRMSPRCLAERANAMTVPSEAVFGGGNQAFVYIVGPDSTVGARRSRSARRWPIWWRSSTGWRPGRVVRAGHQKLFEGRKGDADRGPGGPHHPKGYLDLKRRYSCMRLSTIVHTSGRSSPA